LGELRGEMEAVERQLDTLNADRKQAQSEMDQLQNLLHSLDPSDPRHVSNTYAYDAKAIITVILPWLSNAVVTMCCRASKTPLIVIKSLLCATSIGLLLS